MLSKESKFVVSIVVLSLTLVFGIFFGVTFEYARYVESVHKSQNPNRTPFLELSYLVGNIEQFKGEKVRVIGSVAYESASVKDFMLISGNASILVEIETNDLSKPPQDAIVTVIGTVELEMDRAQINAEKYVILYA